jgi:predicted ArsR family transcriptional regulator
VPAPLYPLEPGYKAPGPSAEAADEMLGRAETLRRQCYRLLHGRPMTADECAAALHESVLAVRPRLSELRTMRLIADSGVRRLNRSGKRATVWYVVRKGRRPPVVF